MASITERISRAWNAFTSRDPTIREYDYGASYGMRMDRPAITSSRNNTIINSIYNRIATSVASVDIIHAEVDENNNFLSPVDSGLNECLSISANIDQTGRQFIIDSVLTLLDEGTICIVPVDKDIPKDDTEDEEILSMRVGKIVTWYPKMVKVNLYNEETGMREDVTLPKSDVAIIENPFYTTMNAPNSTAKRLIHKMNLLDGLDNDACSGKLDIILQLPYVVKTDARRKEAQKRIAEIEDQLKNHKYGIAYTDGTEKIVQLNRPIENQLQKQIEYLTNLLFGQLGISPKILDGSADEQTMLNFHANTLEPILMALTDELTRKFLKYKDEKVLFIKNPFKLVPVNQIADIADRMTRNEIMTSNEVRSIIGFRPSSDPNADELRNKNINQSSAEYVENQNEVGEEE